MKKKELYENILTLATLQFDGHFLEYFVENAQKVVAYYILPRAGKEKNFVEVYINGTLQESRIVFSPRNIFIAYIAYCILYIQLLLKYFSKDDRVYLINFIPVFFFLNNFAKLCRNIEFVYWIGDYWPMNDVRIRLFRWFMHYGHDRTKYTIYLSDRINEKMNKGKILDTKNRKTVAWGIKSDNDFIKKKIGKFIRIAFIGVFVETQGIELLLKVVACDKNIYLKLIGTGSPLLVRKYKLLIQELNIEKQVYFPNKFLYKEDLIKEVINCNVGIALYDVDPNSVTFYADPAKIKQYAELGLPIIMTDAADIANYIKKFHAGEIVDRNVDSVLKAIDRIKTNYSFYVSGLQKFNAYFDYETYFRKRFRFLEKRQL